MSARNSHREKGDSRSKTVSMIQEVISQADFTMGDFLRSRHGRVVDVEEVREVLEIYERELRESGGNSTSARRKFSKTKVERIEHSLTPVGMKKLSDARKTLRMHIEASRRKSQRSERLPPIQVHVSTENYGFQDKPDDFVRKMQEWGSYPVDDRRYYLHMVFRYYFKQYHDYAVSALLVIPQPSYQCILDTLYPNDCANRFPPEFRRFLADSAGRTIAIHSLPVPLKGSASEVTYAYNFEAIPHVSTLRRKIESIVLDWKSSGPQKCQVYPPYLLVGNEHNKFIVERECFARRIDDVKKGLSRISDVDFSKLESVSLEVPAALTAYDDYTLHQFKTVGEQLNERIGFFMRTTYRNIFYALADRGLVDDLFVASGAGMDVLVAFQAFCTPRHKGSTFSFEKDESLCRALLMVVVDVCFFFNVYKNQGLALEDSAKVIVDAVAAVDGSYSDGSYSAGHRAKK